MTQSQFKRVNSFGSLIIKVLSFVRFSSVIILRAIRLHLYLRSASKKTARNQVPFQTDQTLISCLVRCFYTLPQSSMPQRCLLPINLCVCISQKYSRQEKFLYQYNKSQITERLTNNKESTLCIVSNIMTRLELMSPLANAFLYFLLLM